MESKKIKALLAAAETGSLTAAAAQLGYTQAGLTQMMNSVENELGLRMLVRGKHGVRLSDAGQSLLEPMRAFVAAAEELERGVERQPSRGSGCRRSCRNSCARTRTSTPRSRWAASRRCTRA